MIRYMWRRGILAYAGCWGRSFRAYVDWTRAALQHSIPEGACGRGVLDSGLRLELTHRKAVDDVEYRSVKSVT